MIHLDEKAKKVLDTQQQLLLPLLEDFSKTHFLAWGTAIALRLGHRKSIDFDFFSVRSQGTFASFIERIWKYWFDVWESDKERYRGAEFQEQDEIHVSISWVKFSCINFFRTLYDNQIIAIGWKDEILWWLRTASVEELLAMKLFATITRNKWKDAVDIYFLLHYLPVSLEDMLLLCETQYFINIFHRGHVLEQLISAHWDTTESVQYPIPHPPTDEEIIYFLQSKALEIAKKIQ